MAEAHRSGRWLVHTEDSVDSTQNWVKERISALSDLSVLRAASQTSGRGRSGKNWVSPPGGLYFSLLLKPAPPHEYAPRVSLLAALVLAELMEEHGLEPKVKWPNDVIVNGCKLAGIIAEGGNSPESWFILGIGVNLSVLPVVVDREMLPAGAWKNFGDPPLPEKLLSEFLERLDSCWSHRDANPLQGKKEDIYSRLWRKGASVSIRNAGETVRGKITGMSDTGSLILLTDSGERRFVSGELLTVHEESMRQ